MNILQVHSGWDEDEPGGIVAMMVDLMDGLTAEGHSVTLLVNDWDVDQPTAQVDRHDRRYFRMNFAPLPSRLSKVKAMLGWVRRFPAAVWRLRRFCKAQRIDVAQLHYADAQYLLFAVLRLLGGPPYVMTVHRGDVMGYPEQTRLQRWGFQRVMTQADTVVAVSHALGAQAREIAPQIKHLDVIHNGYTPPFATLLNRQQLDQALGVTLPAHFVSLVGNCRPYKGQDIALEAWSLLREAGDLMPLVMVGGGPDLQRMRDLCTQKGLNDWVYFTGPVSRHVAASLTALATIQVAPSRNEGQGIVILEAGHAGTPVVCSDIPPFLEMIQDKVSGDVFENENPRDMAETVKAVIQNLDAAQARAEKLRRRVLDDFSITQMIASYQACYSRLLAGKPRN